MRHFLTRRRPRTPRLLFTSLSFVVVASIVASAGCSNEDTEAGGEVVITCASCLADPTNPFLQYHFDVMEQFNAENAGTYRVEAVSNQYAKGGADRLQHYQRLALADDLPDLFTVNPSELAELQQTGKLMDFAPGLENDPAWRSSFYEGAFEAVDGDEGQVWAVPQTRDTIGIYYNKMIFQDAGVQAFPQTWNEFAAACEKIKSSGKTCFAMDGEWVTLLMWVNLIGTQPEGGDFLTSAISHGEYAENPVVVDATEMLKEWHTAGFINSDAFSGDFQNAATPYLSGAAAMIANGPWFVSTGLRTDDTIAGLYEQTAYAPSPGWTADERGVIVVAGEGSWASGAIDDREQEAVTEFLKYYTSKQVMLEQTRVTGSYGPVEIEFSDKERETLEPLGAGLVEQSSSVPLSYPHAFLAAPAGFSNSWKNLWPAYVQGEMSTEEFLTRLSEESASPMG